MRVLSQHLARLAPWFAAVLMLLGGARAASAAIQYIVTDLGALPGNKGNDYAHAWALNGSGTVVGVSAGGGGPNYAAKFASGGGTDLGRLGNYNYSQARGINDSGQICGWSEVNDPGGYHPFLYSNGVMRDLGAPAGFSHGEALGINNAGQVVGYSYTFTYLHGIDPGHAFLYSGGQITDIGGLPTYDHSEATAINNKGQVVGWSFSYTTLTHAFLYENGHMTDLGGGISGPQPQALNNNGQIVGIQGNAAFLYSNGTYKNLGGLPGATQSYATGINDSGVIVGYSYQSIYNALGDRAFICTDSQNLIDLTSLIDPQSGWSIDAASAINISGQIAAYGSQNGGMTRALLLTPIPEPSAPAAAIFVVVFVITRRGRVCRRRETGA